MTLPVLGTTMVTPPMPVAVTPMPTTVQNMMLMAVPKMDTRAESHTMRLGASLRDRATLPSPLRGLDPSGGYPSRLRSLRSLRAPLARRLADAHRRCRSDTVGAAFDTIVGTTAAFSSRRRFAPRSSQSSPRSPWPASPAAGIASGSVRRHAVPRRCRLRRPPARAPRDAPPGAPVSPLVRALLRSVRAHCSAPRRAVVFTQVRTFPPALPPPCCARPRAAPAALPARSSAAAAPTSRPRRRRFPELRCCSIGRPDRRGGLGSHT